MTNDDRLAPPLVVLEAVSIWNIYSSLAMPVAWCESEREKKRHQHVFVVVVVLSQDV